MVEKILLEVPRKWETAGQKFHTEEDIDEHVDEPLRAACKILFRKGIHTYWSSANAHDDHAMLIIEPKQLSSSNIELARRKFGFSGGEVERIGLELPISPDTQIEEIERYFADLAEQFIDQNQTLKS